MSTTMRAHDGCIGGEARSRIWLWPARDRLEKIIGRRPMGMMDGGGGSSVLGWDGAGLEVCGGAKEAAAKGVRDRWVVSVVFTTSVVHIENIIANHSTSLV